MGNTESSSPRYSTPSREATRARSTAEFVVKVEGGLAELEESAYWLDLLTESGIVPEAKLLELHREANELTAILVTCVKNATHVLTAPQPPSSCILHP